METISDEQQVSTLQDRIGSYCIPQIADPVLALEHYHRYLYAMRFVSGKRVLDVGCGDGYGTAFLSLSASEVVGIDINELTINQARSKYVEFTNARFETADCLEMSPPEKPFDVIVCYQTFEQMDGEEQVRCMANLRNMLAPKGILVASTRDRSARREEEREPGLKHELSAVEFYEFLKRYFGNVIFVGQKPLTLSALWSLHGWQDDEFTLHVREELFSAQRTGEHFTEPVNIIAVCSDEHLPRMIADSSNSLYFDSSHELRAKEMAFHSRQLKTESEQLQSELVRMRKEYSQSTDVVQKLYAENIALKNANAEYQKDVEERTAALHRLENSIAERNDVMEKLQQERTTLVGNVESMKEDNAGLHVWVRELQTQLEEQALRAQRSNEEYEKASAALMNAERLVQEQETMLTALNGENQAVRSRLQEVEQLSEQNREAASEEIERQSRTLNMLTLEVDQLRRTLQEEQEQHKILQIQHRELLQRFDEQLLAVSKGRDEVEALRTRAGEIRGQLEEQTTYVQLYTEENEALKREIAEIRTHDEQEANLAKNMFRENEALKARLAEIQKKADAASELTTEHTALVEQVHALQREKEEYAASVLALEQGYKSRIQEAEEVLLQVEEQKVALREMKCDMEKQTSAFDTYQRSQGDLQQRYNKSQIKVQELQAEISMLEQKLQSISHNPAYKMFSTIGLFPKKDG